MSITDKNLDQTRESLLEKEDEKKQEEVLPQATIGELFMYTTRADKILMTIGMISALVTGLSMPSFVFLFKNLTNGFDITDM
jgi:Ni/Fe-hydrogenase subunit HybB-like protein